jgi:hypothetical protein
MRTAALCSLLAAPLMLCGCLAGLIANDRRDKVESFSRFDSGCSSMRVVEQLGSQRYRLEGCGYSYVYACQDQPRSYPRHARDAALVDFVFTGGMDPNAACHLVQAIRDAPPSTVAGAAVAPDDPGAPGPTEITPAPAVATVAAVEDLRPELPAAAAITRAVSSVEAGLRGCSTAPLGRVALELRIAGSGRLLMAHVTSPLDPRTRSCIEGQLARATVPPFRSETVRLTYLLDLR